MQGVWVWKVGDIVPVTFTFAFFGRQSIENTSRVSAMRLRPLYEHLEGILQGFYTSHIVTHIRVVCRIPFGNVHIRIRKCGVV